MRNIILGAALAAALSIGSARAAETITTTMEPGAVQIAIVVAKIDAVSPRDDTSSYVWISGRKFIINMPYGQVVNLLAGAR